MKLLFLSFSLLISLSVAAGCPTLLLGILSSNKGNLAAATIIVNDFNTMRGYADYSFVFSTPNDSTYLGNLLESLPAGSHILDAGTGEGFFLDDLAKDFSTYNFKLTGISKVAESTTEQWRMFPKSTQLHKFITGLFFDEITNSEILDGFGKVDLLFDLMGIFNYSDNPATVLSRYFSFLKTGGKLLMTTTDSNCLIESGNTFIGVGDWLQSIKGINVRKLQGQFGLFSNDIGDSFEITKINEHIQIPKLSLIHYDESIPPKRIFLLL